MNKTASYLAILLSAMVLVLASCGRGARVSSAMDDARDDVLPQNIIDGLLLTDLTYDDDAEKAVFHITANETIYGSDILTVYKTSSGAATSAIVSAMRRYQGPLAEVLKAFTEAECPAVLRITGSDSHDTLNIDIPADKWARLMR